MYDAQAYDLVVVEDLDVKGMLESPRNGRNTASAAWNTFTSMLEFKCEWEGTHFVEVEPEGTTKECAKCGGKTDKPADRDANAAWFLQSASLKQETPASRSERKRASRQG